VLACRAVVNVQTEINMRTAHWFSACLGALLLLTGCGESTAPPSPPDVLASIPLAFTGGGCHGIFSESIYYVGYTEEIDSPPTALIVDSLRITSQETGSHIVLTRSSPGFTSVEDLLTNGVDDLLIVGLNEPCGGGASLGPESNLYEDRVAGSAPPDLQGFSIERVTVEIDVASFESPGTNPNGDDIWTDVTIEGRVVIEGR
jgi:hypothetical protein